MTRLLACLLIAAAACGGGSVATQPDAPLGGDGGDGGTGYPACHEFQMTGVTVPAHVTGALSGADLQAPAHCATIEASFGVESPGPDSVVRVVGLIPGQAYVVRLDSTADLAFYVATGCGSPTGPTSAQCLLFEDDSSGHLEVGRFVATGTEAYVIVDYFQSSTPRDPSWTVDVYREECNTDDDGDDSLCPRATPACLDGRCVECATSFDCHDVAAPVCNSGTNTCVAATPSACGSDDVHDPADDGPAGAPLLTLAGSGGGSGSISGQMCASPLGESDFVAFTVGSLGETWDFHLDWSGSRLLGLELFDSGGVGLGASYWEQPQRARLTYLPVGTYYARVFELATDVDSTPVAYTLAATRSLGSACTGAADCAAEFRNQVYRGSCVAGACVAIDGDATVAQGSACDSQSDCAPGLSCPSFFFVANSDTRETCEPTCQHDADCAAAGSDYVCTTFLAQNECVQKCTSDAQCPTEVAAIPQVGPWVRLSCDVPSGRCLP